MGSRIFQRRAVGVALVGVLAFAGAACGDDDDDEGASTEETTSTTEGDGGEVDVADYCDTVFGIELGFGAPEPDAEELTALLDEIESAHPDEVDEPLAVMVPAALDALEGDSEGVNSDEFAAARGELSTYNIENCDVETGQVQTIDYGFVGIPTELPAGRHLVEVTNEGAELHEISIFRRNDGVTQSFGEILTLGEEEGQALVTQEAFEFVGEPGRTSYLYADLEPGDYAALCFLPVGATDFATLETLGEDAPPHVTQGMVSEFTVG